MVWVFGIPASLLTIHLYPKIRHEKSKQLLSSGPYYEFFTFAFFRFRQDYGLWDMVVFTRKILIGFVLGYFQSNPQFQLLFCFTVLLANFYAQTQLMPYRFRLNNILECTSLGLLCLFTYVGTTSYSVFQEVLLWISVAICSLFLVIHLGVELGSSILKYCQHKKPNLVRKATSTFGIQVLLRASQESK